jgi:hypothetical protein
VSTVNFFGQNGKKKSQRMRVKAPCGKKKSGKGKRAAKKMRAAR